MTNDQTVTQAGHDCLAEAIAQEIADNSPHGKRTDTYARIYQAAYLGAAKARKDLTAAHSGEGLDHPLLRYVQHLPACKLKMRMGGRCDCGLSDLRRSSEGRSNEVGEGIARIVHSNGPVVIDWMGEALAWRPLDYGTWTPLAALSAPQGEVERLREAALTDDPD